jgi:hypothetical protein
MGYAAKVRGERMRKWAEVASGCPAIWYPFARYAARRSDTDPSNPPVRVVLYLDVRIIPPPGHKSRPATKKALCMAIFRRGELQPIGK